MVILLALCCIACMTALSGCRSTGTLASVGAAGVTPRARSSYSPAGNTLADELQWLAVQTACVGIYNMAETGDYSIGDPDDYYRPGDIREYLAELSGDRTAVDMFYGICFNYAQAAYNDIAQNWDQAIVEFTEAIQQDKNNALAYGERGYAYAEKGNMTRALADFNQAIRLDPASARPYFDRAWLYGIKGDHDKVIADFTTAIRLDPGNAFSYFARGLTYHDYKKDYDKAIADYTEAIRLDPYAAIRNTYGELARLYKDKGNHGKANAVYDQAVAAFTDAIQRESENPMHYSHRAGIYAYQKDYDRAIADYTAAIRLNPDSAYYYSWRGGVYKDKKDYDRAIADYTAAIRLDPDNAWYYSSRGRVHEDKKDITAPSLTTRRP